MVTTYKQFIKTKERFPMVAVVGAGPSLDQSKVALRLYPVVIGVNYIYDIVKLDYLVVTHFMLLLNLSQKKEALPDGTTLVYSEYASDWMYMGSRNPQNEGIRFREYRDLQCGISTIIPAIDMACQLSHNVHLFGVDLKKTEGRQYCEGYRTKQTQDDAFFADWSRVVGCQIEALRRLTKCSIVHIR
jgi:hypothetical protein